MKKLKSNFKSKQKYPKIKSISFKVIIYRNFSEQNVIIVPKIELMLTSGATIDQGIVSKGGGKALPIYTKSTAVIFLDPEDMKKLDIYSQASVKVSNGFNQVILYAYTSPDAPHQGIAFMPRGPWCNLLIDPNTDSSGAPMFKSTKITIEPASSEKPLNMPELMKKYYLTHN
jgi:formylmethanofuran dehydrogenase subunit D